MKRRTPALASAVLAIAGIGSISIGSVAHAAQSPGASVDAQGWWENDSGIPLGGSTTTVDAGQLAVRGSGTGASAVSAVRGSLPADAVAAELTFTVVDGTGADSLLACASTADWAPVQGGAYADRPTADCSATVPVTLEGAVLTVLLDAGTRTFDIVLEPAFAGGLVEDARADVDVVLSTPAVSASVPEPTPTTAPPTTATPARPPITVAAVPIAPTVPAPTTTIAPPPTTAPTPPPTTGPATVPAIPTSEPSAAVAVAVPSEPAAADGASATTARAVGLLFLLLAAASAFVASSPARFPFVAPVLDDDGARGVAHLRSSRHGAPPGLR